jgi:hypothetical protein
MKLSKNKTALIVAVSAVAAQITAVQTLPESVRLTAQLIVTFIAALAIPKP